jgi:putative hemolysin
MDVWIPVAVLAGGLLMSALFSGTETALTALPLSRVETLAGKSGGLRRRAWQRWRRQPHRVLVTILVGNTGANIALSAVATDVATRLFGHRGIGVAVGVMTLVVLVFGEVTPKTFARASPEVLGSRVIVPLAGLDWLLTPLTTPLLGLSELLARWRRVSLAAAPSSSSVEDLRFLLSLSLQEGHLSEQQHRMLQAVLRFEAATVRQVQIPRTDVAFLSADLSEEAVRARVVQLGYSRYPVYRGRDDNVIGVLLVKDLLREGRGERLWTQLVQPPLYVPEGVRVVEVLREMRSRRSHIALTVDEYGAIAGLVTLEDILELIVGDIRDEYDSQELTWHQESATAWLVRGTVTLEKLAEITGSALPANGDYNSVAGLILAKAGRVPPAGSRFREGSLEFEVVQASTRRIDRVRVTLTPGAPPPA